MNESKSGNGKAAAYAEYSELATIGVITIEQEKRRMEM